MYATTGRLISVEGIDGSGKTTLVRGLCEWIAQDLQLPVLSGAEPRGDPHSSASSLQLRTSNLAISSLNHPGQAEREASYFLFLANRALLNPRSKLMCGFNVILDRYIDTTVAYHNEVDSGGSITRLVHHRLNWPQPELTLFLKADVNEAYERQKRSGQELRYNPVRHKQILTRASQIYTDLAANEPDRFFTIEANQRPAMILEIAKNALSTRFGWAMPMETGSRSL